ncbi:MAG: hypothetical protein COS40_07615 [Deltaproteobacteria bacterium CG03_land_8_20_14_0_80_45_14]|nr:MAG: hypothetical protein COS40_07615 [Deltaproteobacteria bacterium CG03_land_8_20_14_0_80_45_14]
MSSFFYLSLSNEYPPRISPLAYCLRSHLLSESKADRKVGNSVWSLQIICLKSLENLEESWVNEDKMTEDMGTHKSFKYENCKIQIDILSKDRGGKFALDRPLSY